MTNPHPAYRPRPYPDDYISTNHGPEACGYGLRWRGAALSVEWLARKRPEPYAVLLLGAPFPTMRRNLLAAIGDFDPAMMIWGAEDAELGFRLWTLGYECLMVPGVEGDQRFRNCSHPN